LKQQKTLSGHRYRGVKMAEYIIKCELCNKSHWSNELCPPIFLVCSPDFDGNIWDKENWHEIRANSAQEAAEEYAKKFDDEHDFIDGDHNVLVKKDNQIFLFSVWAEMRIEYISKDVRSENIENFEYEGYTKTENQCVSKNKQ